MATDLSEGALAVAAIGAMLRFPAVAYAWLRTFLVRRRFSSFRVGWVEVVTNFEPLVILVVGFFLFRTISGTAPATPAGALIATLGAVVVLLGWAFQIWAFLSWTSLFAGHGVLDDQELMTRGAYSVVRHPAYSGVILVWLGLATAFVSPVVFAFAALYAIPIYVLYARAEESMMLESFGDTYRDYCRDVPMLIPRFGAGQGGAPAA